MARPQPVVPRQVPTSRQGSFSRQEGGFSGFSWFLTSTSTVVATSY